MEKKQRRTRRSKTCTTVLWGVSFSSAKETQEHLTKLLCELSFSVEPMALAQDEKMATMATSMESSKASVSASASATNIAKAASTTISAACVGSSKKNTGTESESTTRKHSSTNDPSREHDERDRPQKGDQQASAEKPPKLTWRSAVDPASGRVYYYHVVTHATQWEKPAEIRALEKRRKKEQRKRDILFFQEMERNIVSSLARGEIMPGTPFKDLVKQGPPKEPLQTNPPANERSRAALEQRQEIDDVPLVKVRTISAMNEHLLAQIGEDPTPSDFVPPSPSQKSSSSSLSSGRRRQHSQQQRPQRSPSKTRPTATSTSSNAAKIGRPPLPERSSSTSSSSSSSGGAPDKESVASAALSVVDLGTPVQSASGHRPAPKSAKSGGGNTTTHSISAGGAMVAPRLSGSAPASASAHMVAAQVDDDLQFSPEAGYHNTPAGHESDLLRGEQLLDGFLCGDQQKQPQPFDLSGTPETTMVSSSSGSSSGSDGFDESGSLPPSGTPSPAGRPSSLFSHKRINTCGTMYVESTMDAPDIAATIKCVCGVYRAHIVQSTKGSNRRPPVSVNTARVNMDIFLDRYDDHPRSPNNGNGSRALPSMSEIESCYHEFYQRSQMAHDTIIMSLIYVERLIKETNGVLTPTSDNWCSVLFSCMILASKVWDDLSMWNIDFSNVSSAATSSSSRSSNSSSSSGKGREGASRLSAFSLQRINQLELAVLTCLNFYVTVPASEYAKYYFLIRTMLQRSGQLSTKTVSPLNQNQVRLLEQMTRQYESSRLTQPGNGPRDDDNNEQRQSESSSRRASSIDFGSFFSGSGGVNASSRGGFIDHSNNYNYTLGVGAQSPGKTFPPQSTTASIIHGSGPVLNDTVCLEQIVTMNR